MRRHAAQPEHVPFKPPKEIQMQKLTNWVNRNRFILAGVLLGSIGGFLYWNFIGCSSGTCSITSKPLNSTLYGALLGGTLLSALTPDQKQNNKS
jgi:hypothetical protein